MQHTIDIRIRQAHEKQDKHGLSLHMAVFRRSRATVPIVILVSLDSNIRREFIPIKRLDVSLPNLLAPLHNSRIVMDGCNRHIRPIHIHHVRSPRQVHVHEEKAKSNRHFDLDSRHPSARRHTKSVVLREREELLYRRRPSGHLFRHHLDHLANLFALLSHDPFQRVHHPKDIQALEASQDFSHSLKQQ